MRFIITTYNHSTKSPASYQFNGTEKELTALFEDTSLDGEIINIINLDGEINYLGITNDGGDLLWHPYDSIDKAE